MSSRDDQPDEISVRDLRGNLAAAINRVATRGTTLYVTSHGRRIVAIVPVAIAEQNQQQKG